MIMRASSVVIVALLTWASAACDYPYPAHHDPDAAPDAAPPVCNNGRIEDGEDCDGVFLGGATCSGEGRGTGNLACNASCSYDFTGCHVCGNGAIDGPEVCDGMALNEATCQSRGHARGLLRCQADCLAFDDSNCSTCGNGVREGSEDCDPPDWPNSLCQDHGFAGGPLTCSACVVDTSQCTN